MESIKSALQALKNGISKSKTKPSPDALAAADKLSGVPDFLKLNVLQAPDFLKLSTLLRDTMQPLFEHDLALTLHFASAVFLGIYNAKVTRSDDISERRTWEMAQSSVLSGILDYLDDHKTAKAKGPIGQAFFTTLCRLYFSSAVDQPVKADSDLLATVYMLLSDIVSGQAGNAAAFRKELMGGQRLGYTIYHMKAFLPLEAALELFGNVLFGFKGSSRDRAKFIRDVFTSKLYSNSSGFVELLSTVTDSDGWSKASPRVIKLISSLDVAFTQPFEVKDFRLRGCNTKKVDNVYVDEKAFLVSVPVGDSVDTLVINFSDVEHAALSSSGQQIAVTLKLNSPPNIGKNPVKCGPQNIEAHWTLEKSEVGRFIKGLKHRKVVINAKNLEYNRKQSIAEAGIVLQRETNSPPKPTQEKVEVIQNLWGDAESNRGGTDCLPTSPFLPRILHPNFEEGRALSRAEEPSKTVFIDGEGNLTDKPARVEQMPPPSTVIEKASNVKPDPILMSKALSVLTRTLSAGKRPEQEQVSLRKLLSRRKSRVVVSDEGSEVTDPDDPPSPSPMRSISLRPAPSGGKPETGIAVAKSGTGDKKASAPAAARLNKPPLKQEKSKLQEKDVPGAKASAAFVKREASAPPRTVTLKKRSAPEPVDDDDEEPPAPPAKKARPSPTTRPPPSTRYSKRKLRNSSPINVDVSDDDEPPKAPSTVLKRPLLDSKKKKAVMKDRNGQTNTKKPAPRPRRKAATYQNKENTPHVKSPTPAIMSLRKESEVKPPLKIDPLSVKKGAVTPHVKPKEAPKSTEVKRSNKPKQAPWQRDSFAANIRNQSTPPPPKQPEEETEPEQNSMDWDPAPAGALDFESVKPAEQEVIVLSDDSNASKTFVTEPVVEYWMPTKGANDSFDEPVIVKMEEKDVEMVDLTSPVKPVVAPAVVKKTQAVTTHKVETQVDAGTKQNAIENKVEEEDNHKKGRESFSRVETPKHDIRGTNIVPAKNEKIEHPTKASADVTRSVDVKQPENKIRSGRQDKEPEQPSKVDVPVKSSDVGGGAKNPATVSKKIGKLPSYPRMPSERPPERPKAMNWKDEHGREEYTLRLPRLQPTDRGIHQRLQRDSPKGFSFQRDVPPRRYQRPANAPRNAFQQRDSSEPGDDILEVGGARSIGYCEEAKLFVLVPDYAPDKRGDLGQNQSKMRGYEPGVGHFNALVDIDAEYATHRRKIMTAIDGFRKGAEQAGQAIKQITQNHGRHGLSKKFSPTLFTKPVPTATLDF